MKKSNTKYLIEDSVPDLQKIIPQKRGLREITIVVMIPTAIVGLGVMSMMLPMTMTIDSYKNLKDQYKIKINK